MALTMTGLFDETGVGSNAVAVLIRSSDGAYWSTAGGGAFEAYNASNIANYAIALTEVGATGVYTASHPSETTPSVALFIKKASTNLAASDLVSNRRSTQGYNTPNLAAADVRSAVGLASANLDTQLAAIDDYLDTEVAAIKSKTDNLPASPAAVSDIPTASTVASQVRTELTTELGRIDATVSSRLAASSYTAPDNTSITAIKSKTDNLPASPAAVGSAMTLTSGERSSIATAVWEAATSALATVGSIGKLIVDKLSQLTFTTANQVDATAIGVSVDEQAIADAVVKGIGDGLVTDIVNGISQAGVPVVRASTFDASGKIYVSQNADYYNADGFPLEIVVDGFSGDLSNAANYTLRIASGTTETFIVNSAPAAGSGSGSTRYTFTFDLPRSQMANLDAGTGTYDLFATLANGHQVPVLVEQPARIYGRL